MSKKIYPYQESLERKFEKWNGFINDDIKEAIQDVSGDTYLELRKLTSLLLTLVEKNIQENKYTGYQNGKPLTEEQKLDLAHTDEDLKLAMKEIINSVWVSIINKQKVGFDKLFITISQIYDKKDKEN